MKPTKEQLADPKWWDENANGYDCVFYLERNDEYIFADDNGEGINFKLIVGAAGWKLLAKRPEPKWVPEVGTEFEYCNTSRDDKYHLCFFVGYDADGDMVVQREDGLKGLKHKNFNLDFRPIKTQREEFIEKAIETMNNSIDDSQQGWAEALFDSGLFDLTGKDDK